MRRCSKRWYSTDSRAPPSSVDSFRALFAAPDRPAARSSSRFMQRLACSHHPQAPTFLLVSTARASTTARVTVATVSVAFQSIDALVVRTLVMRCRPGPSSRMHTARITTRLRIFPASQAGSRDRHPTPRPPPHYRRTCLDALVAVSPRVFLLVEAVRIRQDRLSIVIVRPQHGVKVSCRFEKLPNASGDHPARSGFQNWFARHRRSSTCGRSVLERRDLAELAIRESDRAKRASSFSVRRELALAPTFPR